MNYIQYLLSTLRFHIMFRNYSSSTQLDRVIESTFKYELKTIRTSEHYIHLQFENDITLNFWNANKYCSWCQKGWVVKNGNTIYEWDNVMPSRKMLHKLYVITTGNHLSYGDKVVEKIKYQLGE